MKSGLGLMGIEIAIRAPRIMALPMEPRPPAAGENLSDTTPAASATASSPTVSSPASPHPSPAPLPTHKKLVFSLVLLGLLWGVLERACLVGLWALNKYKDLEYSPE